MSRRNEYRFPWSLADQFVCVYCWSGTRGIGCGIREAWTTARQCRRTR